MICKIHPRCRDLLEFTFSKASRLGVVLLLSIVTPHPVLAVATIPGTTIWQAPVGHRQPSAHDVKGVGITPILDAEDREISRKLKICRGC
jgi:hypothetical protein